MSAQADNTRVEIGLGLDSRLGLSTAQLRELAPLAKELGYQSLWTNAGTDYDPIGMCVAWNQITGLPTGVSVVPIARNPPDVLAHLPEAYLASVDVKHWIEMQRGVSNGTIELKKAMNAMPRLARVGGACPCSKSVRWVMDVPEGGALAEERLNP